MEKNTAKDIPKKKNGKKDIEARKEAISKINMTKVTNLGLLAVLILLISFTSGIIFLNSTEINITESTPLFIKKIIEANNNLFQRTSEVKPAAVVNNEPITMEELEKEYYYYSQFTSSTKSKVLSQMIDEKILIQEALKKNFNFTSEQVKEEIAKELEIQEKTQQDLEEMLVYVNYTFEDFENKYMRVMLISALLNETVFNSVNVSDEEINDYYFENSDFFKIPERVNVSHILICHNQSTSCFSDITKEDALKKAKEIRTRLNDTNFAEMARQNSDEPAANITGGALPGTYIPGYVIMLDPYDKTFLNATFELNTGEVSQPVETEYGYHLIKVYDKQSEELIDIKEVYDEINNTLTSQKEQEKFAEYMGLLKNNSVIMIFLENN